jgi:3-hydroxy-3-methylglutaryl CoA synthase
MVGIVAFGAYVPRLRLNRQAAYDANKWFAPGLRGLAKGERSMANWDEDSITMAVEASRDCLTSHKAEDVRNIYFASTTHPFKDRQNAGVIGTALNVEQNLSAMDVGGSLKAGTSALIAGLNASRKGASSLVAAADKRMARVASAGELNYGDGAAALLCGTENVIAKLVGHHSVSMDFVDHFRGDESRFRLRLGRALDPRRGLLEDRAAGDQGRPRRLQAQGQRHHPLHHAEPDAGGAQADGQGLRHRRRARCATCSAPISATPVRRMRLVMLVDALETAKAGDKIMVVAFGQGVDSLVFEVTAENAKLAKRKGLSGWMARRKEEKNYMKFLAFNEMLPIDKGMRAEFDKKTALSVLWRKRDMIYGLVGGKCKVCGTVQFPRSQVCVNPNCHAIDSQEPYAMAGSMHVMSFTADSLTYSPDPPAYYGMITFPEGGRFMADFTDSDKEQVKVGAKMRMTFRIRDNDTMRGGFKRYFWKAAPFENEVSSRAQRGALSGPGKVARATPPG